VVALVVGTEEVVDVKRNPVVRAAAVLLHLRSLQAA
jgi:hypothetical protein